MEKVTHIKTEMKKQTLKEMAKTKVLVHLNEADARIIWDLHEVINVFKIYGNVAPENRSRAYRERTEAEGYLESVCTKLKAFIEEIKEL